MCRSWLKYEGVIGNLDLELRVRFTDVFRREVFVFKFEDLVEVWVGDVGGIGFKLEFISEGIYESGVLYIYLEF